MSGTADPRNPSLPHSRHHTKLNALNNSGAPRTTTSSEKRRAEKDKQARADIEQLKADIRKQEKSEKKYQENLNADSAPAAIARRQELERARKAAKSRASEPATDEAYIADLKQLQRDVSSLLTSLETQRKLHAKLDEKSAGMKASGEVSGY